MGLTSLAQINRSGVYDFWDSVWDTKYLYKHLTYNTFIFKDIFNEILSFFFFKYLFNRKVGNLGYNSVVKFEFKLNPVVYFSKIWILRYQSWFVLIMYYYNLSNYFKKKNRNFNKIYKYQNFFRVYKNYNYEF